MFGTSEFDLFERATIALEKIAETAGLYKTLVDAMGFNDPEVQTQFSSLIKKSIEESTKMLDDASSEVGVAEQELRATKNELRLYETELELKQAKRQLEAYENGDAKDIAINQAKRNALDLSWETRSVIKDAVKFAVLKAEKEGRVYKLEELETLVNSMPNEEIENNAIRKSCYLDPIGSEFYDEEDDAEC